MVETVVKKATERFGFDITVILAIIEAVMVIFEKCPKPSTAAERLKNPGPLDRVRLRMALRRQCREDESCFSIRHRVNDICDALEAETKNLSIEDCEICVGEAMGNES